jgi:hypothetical protein
MSRDHVLLMGRRVPFACACYMRVLSVCIIHITSLAGASTRDNKVLSGTSEAEVGQLDVDNK